MKKIPNHLYDEIKAILSAFREAQHQSTRFIDAQRRAGIAIKKLDRLKDAPTPLQKWFRAVRNLFNKQPGVGK